jgi:dephospho-CoA kinase
LARAIYYNDCHAPRDTDGPAQLVQADRLERADIVIDNSRSLEELDFQVAELHKEFLLRAETAR